MGEPDLDLDRPLTARSVLASTLLGTDPPRLPVSFLVRTGALFGLSDGAVRTALSRMVAAGDLSTDGDGWYALTEDLSQRRERQERSRAAVVREDWSGRWWIGVVAAGPRAARDRAELRREMSRLRLAELRDGVWVRPDNLDQRPDRSRAGAGCTWFLGDPLQVADGPDGIDALADRLWDLEHWSARATELRRSMQTLLSRIERGDVAALAPGFMLSAAVLRQFLADPLLPRELLSRDWPGGALRRDYDRYDAAYRAALADWSALPGTGGSDH